MDGAGLFPLLCLPLAGKETLGRWRARLGWGGKESIVSGGREPGRNLTGPGCRTGSLGDQMVMTEAWHSCVPHQPTSTLAENRGKQQALGRGFVAKWPGR